MVEICEPPNVRGQALHHLAQKSPSEGSRIVGLQLPSLGDIWHAALSLHRLNVENVVKGPDHLITPSLKKIFYFGPCWATLPLRQQTLHDGVPQAVHETIGRGGGGYSRPRGAGGIKGGVRQRACAERGGCGDEAKPRAKLGMWWCKGWGW